MKIRDFEIVNPVFLAPMAGVADKAFRELCMKNGAGACVGEMVSAKGVTMGDRKSRELMLLSDMEHPAAIQIFGCDPKTMAKAAVSALEFCPDYIDINMGCPAPKIVKNGGGSALSKNPRLAGEIVKAVVNAVPVPVTVKIRKGWDAENTTAVEMAKYAEDNGASMITVHGRTREQMYSPPVDLDIIAQVKRSVSVPVIGNGDIVDGISAKNMLDYTGVDGIMIGRGALGRPWVFSAVNAYLSDGVILPEPTPEEKMGIMLSHIRKICEYKGEHIGINESRKHAVWYTKGIRNSSAFRLRLSLVKSMDELETLANEIILASSNE